MTTCKGCGRELTAEDLVRHERGRFVVVHCPNCKYLLGRYNRHGDDPKTDHREGSTAKHREDSTTKHPEDSMANHLEDSKTERLRE